MTPTHPTRHTRGPAPGHRALHRDHRQRARLTDDDLNPARHGGTAVRAHHARSRGGDNR